MNTIISLREASP